MYRVFSRVWYLLGALLAASLVLGTVLAAQNLDVLGSVLSSSGTDLSSKLALSYSVLTGSFLDITVSTQVYLLSIALLIGINISLLVFYFHIYRFAPSSVPLTSGVLGTFSALLGFGCAACGSLFITSLFATVGGAGLLALLPYQGMEIGWVGIALLLLSAHTLVRGINKPPVCPI